MSTEKALGAGRRPSVSPELEWLRDWLENTPQGIRFMRRVAETPRDYARELARHGSEHGEHEHEAVRSSVRSSVRSRPR